MQKKRVLHTSLLNFPQNQNRAILYPQTRRTTCQQQQQQRTKIRRTQSQHGQWWRHHLQNSASRERQIPLAYIIRPQPENPDYKSPPNWKASKSNERKTRSKWRPQKPLFASRNKDLLSLSLSLSLSAVHADAQAQAREGRKTSVR